MRPGILIANSSNAVIQGNKVGVGADGVTALGNAAVGIQISSNVEFDANDNTIGGTDRRGGQRHREQRRRRDDERQRRDR